MKTGRKDGCGIGPHTEKGSVTEGNLPGEADKDVKTDRSNCRNTDRVDDIEHVWACEPRNSRNEKHDAYRTPKAAKIGCKNR